MRHNYPDEELKTRVIGLAEHLGCQIRYTGISENKQCLIFIIEYAREQFFSDLLEVRNAQYVPFFISDGMLFVYRKK